MFDPKSILDALVRGNAQQAPGASSGGGLEDLLRKFPARRRRRSRRICAIRPICNLEGAPSGSGNSAGRPAEQAAAAGRRRAWARSSAKLQAAGRRSQVA